MLNIFMSSLKIESVNLKSNLIWLADKVKIFIAEKKLFYERNSKNQKVPCKGNSITGVIQKS